MAIKIKWKEPKEDNIDKVEIYRSKTRYGEYTLLETIDAKSGINWVVEYIDYTGLRTHWYKVKFLDSVTGISSEFSDEISPEDLFRLCTVDEVSDILDITGRWTRDEVFRQITEVDDLIYIEAGSPIQAVWFEVYPLVTGEMPDMFYCGEENVYRVDRVFVGKDTLVELFVEDEYKTNNYKGMIKMIPVADRSEDASDVEVVSGDVVEIHFVPGIYNKLSKYRTAKRLLERMEVTSGDSPSKDYVTITRALKDIEQLIIDRFGVQLSSDMAKYDSLYGVNLKKIKQDYKRNNYIGKHGWS